MQTGAPTRPRSIASTSASDLAGRRPFLHRNPTAVAWVVLWTSFAGFLLLCAAAIAGGLYYRATATDGRPATVSVIGGTVLVHPGGRGGGAGVPGEGSLQPGDMISTDDFSRALVTLADGSTITVFPATQLTLSTSEALRFGDRKSRFRLSLERGKIRVGVAPPVFGETELTVRTPEASVALSEGSYTFELVENRMQVWVREIGSATVSAGGQVQTLRANQRLEVARGGPLGDPLPARQELVANGDFEDGLTGWNAGNRNFNAERPPAEQDVVGTITAVAVDGRRTVHFLRQGSRGAWNESFLAQDINRDVSDFSSLHLSLEFKLVNQSVPGGGYQGSEYPVLIRILYRSATGESAFHVFGYYYQNEGNNPTTNGKQVPQNQWVSLTIPENLMNMSPTPRLITAIEVTASGHDYESYVSKVSLVGE